MELTTILATITALVMHHLSLTVAAVIANHATAPNASLAGFSFWLVANHEGPDHTIRRGSDGFLHLQHSSSLCPDLLPLPSSSSSSGVAGNVTTLRPAKMNITPLQLPYAVAIAVGTGNGRKEYQLKVDTSTSLTWLQCAPCNPEAPQSNPIFDPPASPTFHNVMGTSKLCHPPYMSKGSGAVCAFSLTGPRGLLVKGLLSLDRFTLGQKVHQHALFGCSHSTKKFQSKGRYAGIAAMCRAPSSLVMQLAARGLPRFSYCLFGGGETNRQGFLCFGADVPHNPSNVTTKILPALHAHESEYYVSLVGVSLGARRLDGILLEMLARRKDGQGGCVVDLGTPLSVMVLEAYDVVEEAMWSDIQRHGAERVKRLGYGLCVQERKAVKGRLQSLSLHFSEEKAVLVFSPEQLFLMMDDDKQGQIACLAMARGRRTVIGAIQQVDTRFIYDLKDSKISIASESCTRDTAQVL